MINKRDRKDLVDALVGETFGLKKNEMAYFIGALMSNLAHNLPAKTAGQLIASFKESRETTKDIVLSLKESGMKEIK